MSRKEIIEPDFGNCCVVRLKHTHLKPRQLRELIPKTNRTNGDEPFAHIPRGVLPGGVAGFASSSSPENFFAKLFQSMPLDHHWGGEPGPS